MRSRAPFADVRRIAVLRGGGIGDLLFAVPALHALHRAYPDAEVTVLAGPHAAQLLPERLGFPVRVTALPPIPGVNDGETSAGDPDDGPDAAAGLDAFVAAQRAELYDLAVQLHGGGRHSNPFLLRLGARHTVGCRTPDAAALERELPYVYYQHEVLRALELAAIAGAGVVGADELEPRLTATATDRDGAHALLAQAGVDDARPLVVVHPGATDPRRRWPAERFGQVAAALVEGGARVVVTGDASDAPLAEAVARAAACGPRELVVLAGAASLPQLVGLLAEASLLIGNDSGPRHLAQALGTATVGVYWFGNVVNAAPLARADQRIRMSWISACPVCGRDVTQVGWTAQRCEHDVSFVADVSICDVLSDAWELLPTSRPGRLELVGDQQLAHLASGGL